MWYVGFSQWKKTSSVGAEAIAVDVGEAVFGGIIDDSRARVLFYIFGSNVVFASFVRFSPRFELVAGKVTSLSMTSLSV